MSESTNLTYYQRNRDALVNKKKDYYKNKIIKKIKRTSKR